VKRALLFDLDDTLVVEEPAAGAFHTTAQWRAPVTGWRSGAWRRAIDIPCAIYSW
jgi:hypothetical protein